MEKMTVLNARAMAAEVGALAAVGWGQQVQRAGEARRSEDETAGEEADIPASRPDVNLPGTFLSWCSG